MQPVQILLSVYQRVVFPSDDSDPATPPNGPDPAGIDFTNLGQTAFGDSGFMRIMRFDTATGTVDVETFIPPAIPIKNRPSTIVSTYFPANGDKMDSATASNISFSFKGYVPDTPPAASACPCSQSRSDAMQNWTVFVQSQQAGAYR